MMSQYPPLQPETLEQQQEKKQHPISRKPSPSHVDSVYPMCVAVKQQLTLKH